VLDPHLLLLLLLLLGRLQGVLAHMQQQQE
jgi:hypothetical protein